MSVIEPTLADLTLADLIADAAKVRLPAPSRTDPEARVIDLRIPAPRTIELTAVTINLLEGYADSHL